MKTVLQCCFMNWNSVPKCSFYTGWTFFSRPSSPVSCIPSSCANRCKTSWGALPLWSISNSSNACVSIKTLPSNETEQNTSFYCLRTFCFKHGYCVLKMWEKCMVYFWNTASLSIPGLTETNHQCFLKNACHTWWLTSTSYIFCWHVFCGCKY